MRGMSHRCDRGSILMGQTHFTASTLGRSCSEEHTHTHTHTHTHSLTYRGFSCPVCLHFICYISAVTLTASADS